MRTLIVMGDAVCGTLISTAAVSGTDPVLEWNSIMVNTTAGQNPFFQARFAAITQLAVFEAVNAIDKDFEPYLGTITAPSGASPDAAAVAAAHAVLKNYFPGDASALDAAYDASLARIPNGPAKQNGIEVGEAAAAALIALRTGDGSAPPEFYSPTSSAPGEWQPTPSCPPTGGAFLQWRTCARLLRTRALGLLAPRRRRHSRASSMRSATTRSCAWVVSTVRSDPRIAPSWPDSTPNGPGAGMEPVAAQVAVAQGRSMSENARVGGRWTSPSSTRPRRCSTRSIFHEFWRPETAIHAKGRRHEALKPYIVTPCFPGYGSAHGSLSNAAPVLEAALWSESPFHHLEAIRSVRGACDPAI